METPALAKDNTQQQHPSYYWDYLMKNPHSVGKKIMIIFAGRSGSMMLSGLLDGHSHLLSFNYWLDGYIFVQLKSRLFDFNQKRPTVSAQAFQEFLQKNLPGIFEEYFFNHNFIDQSTKQKNKFSYETFFENIRLICNNLTADIDFNLAYNILFIAYGKTQNHPLNTTCPHMIIQVHGPHGDLENILSNLDNSSFLVCTRDTIKAIDSYFSIHSLSANLPDASYIDFYARMLTECSLSFLAFFDKKFQEKIACIFYEDLHLNNLQTMNALCKYIGIPFEEILTKETLNRHDCISYSIHKAGSMSGPSQKKLDNTVKFLGRLDVYFIEYLFKDLIVDLGYSLRSNKFQRMLGIFMPRKKQLVSVVKNISQLYHSQMLRIESSNSSSKTPSFLQKMSKNMRVSFLIVKMPFIGIILRRKFKIRRNETPYKLSFIR